MHNVHVGSPQRTQHRVLLAVFLWAVVGPPLSAGAQATQENPPERDYGRGFLPAPYCGISCMYTVLKMAGRNVDYQDLIRHEYIGSYKGSSTEELQRLAEDYGLYALPAGRLTTRYLRNCPYPVLLHVKRTIAANQYDHFELFLGKQDGQAKLFDPPDRIMTIPFHMLAPRWDGRGILVSTEPIDLKGIHASFRRLFVPGVVCTVIGIVLLRWMNRLSSGPMPIRRRKRVLWSAAQSVGIALAALLTATVYHVTRDEGLLANSQGTAAIQQAHLAGFAPKIGIRSVERLIPKNTIFVDARYREDFTMGHLDGAINIPVDVNDADCLRAMAGVAPEARIVVYCRSRGCRFADKIAARLISNGFVNVSIFRGGWLEWRERARRRTD